MEYTCISCDLIAWGTSLPKCSEILAPINTLCDSSRHMCTLLAKYMVPVFHILLKSSDDCKLSLDPAWGRLSIPAKRKTLVLICYWSEIFKSATKPCWASERLRRWRQRRRGRWPRPGPRSPGSSFANPMIMTVLKTMIPP